MQVAGCAVKACSYGDCNFLRSDNWEFLSIDTLAAAASLPALLTALRPGSVPAVRRLHLANCVIDGAALGRCTALGSVVRMCLRTREAVEGGWEAAHPSS